MKFKPSLRAFGFAACIGCLTLQSVSAQSFFDNGGGDNLWSNNLNWSGDAPPSGNIAIANGLTAISNSNVTLSSGDLTIGADGSFGLNTGPAGDGTLEVTAGTFSTSIGMRLGVAAATTTGTLTIKDSGTVDITAGNLLAGNFNGIAATGVINVQTGGTLNLSTTGLQRIGHGSSGTLNISGGTMNQSNGTLEITAGGGLNGAFNMTAGTLNVNQEMRIGNAYSITTGSQSGGTINKLATQVGNFAVAVNSAPIQYSHTGGTLNVEDTAGSLIIGWNSGDVEVFGGQSYTLNGGIINVGQTSQSGLRLALGVVATTMHVQSGSVNVGASSGYGLRIGEFFGGGGNGIMNVSGGDVTVNGGNMWLGFDDACSGVLNQSGGNVTLASGQSLVIGNSASSTGIYNQSAGALNVGGDLLVGNGAAGTWNLSGGTHNITGNLAVAANSAININSGGNLTKAPSINNGGVVNVNTGGALGEGATVNSGGLLKFNGGNGAGVLGKYITMNGGAVDVNGQSIANLTWDAVVSAAPGSKITNSSATAATIANTVAGNTIWLCDAAGGDTTIEAAGNLTIDSWVTDISQITPQGITKTGNGTLFLTNPGNNYRGETTINAGTLSLSNPTLSDSSTVNINGGTLNLNFSGQDQVDKAYAYAGVIYQRLGPGQYGATDGVGITGSGYIRVAQGYDSWAADLAADSPPLTDSTRTGDPDNDGLNNAAEYALGFDPRYSSGSPGVASNGGKTITFTKGAQAKYNDKVTYEIETSISLGAEPTPWTVDVTNVTDGTDTISITFPAGPVKDFARLKITLVP